jgi:outer membrane immunogenic protein
MRRIAMLFLSMVAFAGMMSGAEAQTKKRLVTKAVPITKAPPAPVSRSLGLYIGVNGGYGWNRATFYGPPGARDFHMPTGMAGLTFGYNAQSGAWVYGIETDIDGAWNKGTNTLGAPCLGCEVRITYLGTVRGRAGYAVGQSLPFITGGFAYGGVQAGLPTREKDTDNKSGWTAGGGVEYALPANWSLKTEYLYFELGKTGCSALNCGTDVAVKTRGNLLRAGANYRF